MSSRPVNYAKTYFLHLTLTLIQGEPEYSIFKILKKELKDNASRVTSDLEGGGHDHHGLALTPHEYSIISAVLYAFPVHPGMLAIPPMTSQHESTSLTFAHAKVVRVFRKKVELEKSSS